MGGIKRICLLVVFAYIFSSDFVYGNVFIRINQIGFSPDDIKTGIVIADKQIDDELFEVIESKYNRVLFSGKIRSVVQHEGRYKYAYQIDFSSLKDIGSYYVKIGDSKSYLFRISNNLYNAPVDSLLRFFEVQRCGYTNPSLHGVCHGEDASYLIDAGKRIDRKLDLTGGWHDAGDYVKFLNTTAYTTYTLLFAYEFDKNKFGFDNDGNSVPDLLEEAKIGLDWLLRCNFDKYKLISQVQDLKDHTVGWRMPENDPLVSERPAFIGRGKNLVGIYVATMALASRIWRNEIRYDDFANKCLTVAENIYSTRNEVPNVDSSGSGVYLDNAYGSKMALGAVELYLTTGQPKLLDEAKKYADKEGSDYWWSYGNIGGYAYYKLGKLDKKYIDYLVNNLNVFSANADSNSFNLGTPYSWGTNNTLLGVALQGILYKRLTGSNRYDSLAIYQRDFVLGRNQWGVSFLTDFGTRYSKNLHHQVSHLRKIKLPGGFAAGPVTKETMKNYNIPFSGFDRFKNFQTENGVYYDDRNDYVTNEPTIVANATAIFVMGYYSER